MRIGGKFENHKASIVYLSNIVWGQKYVPFPDPVTFFFQSSVTPTPPTFSFERTDFTRRY